ncbi:MAG: SAM-dependent chlorinase/fluorinase [Chloroflexi bacterium]|nr:SAM-dependent chlorinase/fluorinase [Chloroflexota bacterium]
MGARPVITLTTDFGLADPCVAAMKGVVLSLNPDAVTIDVSHEVRPHSIEQGAFLLACSWPHFPAGSIHVAVVDPGVGTARRALALQTAAGFFVGPDNGVLSAALPDDARAAVSLPSGTAALPEDVRAVALTNERYFRHPVSVTFHGRDVFAPVAAHISLGVPLEELGEPVESVVALPPFRAASQPDGSLVGRVVHIDRFGNVVTDIRQEDLPAANVEVEIAGRTVAGLARTYGDAKGLVALIGSAGYLELSLPNGNAASALNVDIGAAVGVIPAAPPGPAPGPR